MIIAIWQRWRQQHQWWWLILLAAVMVVDVVIGSWLVAWEITHMREWMP